MAEKELFGNSEQLNDLISRQAALTALNGLTEIYLNNLPPTIYKSDAVDAITALPPAQPEIIRCKDCKRWRDSDGVYRRGTDAESKCPLNTKEVYAGTFYCGYAERRTDG